jgi:SAM-dependent methyltransferase
MFDLDLIYSVQPDALIKRLTSLQEWLAFSSQMDVTDRRRMNATVAFAESNGVRSLFIGGVSPAKKIMHPNGLYVDIVSAGIDTRQRALLDLLESTPFARSKQTTRILAGEALSALGLAMRSKYPRFLGTQYIPGAKEKFFPILHADFTELAFPSNSFDVVFTLEVLEHIPDLSAAMREMARVLAPGGMMLATFPFAFNSENMIVKAVMDCDKVKHLVETPEYHGDIVSAEGVLVFQIPGWDIIDFAKARDFREAYFVFYHSAIGGIIGYDVIGQFVFVACK